MTVNAFTIRGLSVAAPTNAGPGDTAGVALLDAMPPPLRHALLGRGIHQAIGPGEMLFRRHDPARAFYGVMHGCLKVSTLRPDGQEAILAMLRPGDCFGETSLVNGTLREHDVSAVEASRLLKIDAPSFAVLLCDADFSQAIARLMAARIHRLYAALEDGVLKPGPKQIARRLLWLARGDTGAITQPRMSLRVSQETLATMLGITRQTLAKQLRLLAAAGCIAQRYGRIEVLSLRRLEQIAAVE